MVILSVPVYNTIMNDNSKQPVPLSILVVDDETNIRKTLAFCLEAEGHKVIGVSNFKDAVAEALRQAFDMAFVDLRLGLDNGLDLIPALQTARPRLKIIVITAYATIDTAVEAMRRGATDYIPKPFIPAQVKLAVQKVAEMRSLEQRIESLQEDLGRSSPEIDLSSAYPAVQRAISLARQVAPTYATVLFRVMSGTGKSVLARTIHAWSNRQAKPFAVVSCPMLSEELLQSELFGHVKGAFTNAVRDNPGRIAACEGGTLFLDEIGDLPLAIQPKLLRVIQEREYERLGDQVTRKADVRIIAATNTDLEQAVDAGRFREDLFYRLNVFQIEMPPLRERPDDIPALAKHLLAFFGRNNHRSFSGFTPEALDTLKQYAWPGNLRELRNTIERASILCHSEWIGPEYLHEEMLSGSGEAQKPGDMVSLEKIEEDHIRRVLAATKSLQEAADILGIDQATLWRRRKKYGI